jgi:hypothetical protein
MAGQNLRIGRLLLCSQFLSVPKLIPRLFASVFIVIFLRNR